MKPARGRLVLNHSTHIRLIQIGASYQTVFKQYTWSSGRANGHAPDAVRVCNNSGFKIIIAREDTVQEVFILTTLSQDELEDAIAIALKIDNSLL